MSKAPTRSDVARKAGVSVAVVSYVVNGGPRPVADGTRTRVLAAIDELGYRPNANARALRASSTRTLGLVVPSIANPFFAELAEAIESVAFSRGRTVLVGSSRNDVRREAQYVAEMLERRIDGVLLISTGGPDAANDIIDAGVPLVLIDRPVTDVPGIPLVAIDNVAASRVAVDHLVGHGHTRVGCVAGPTDQRVARDRHAGWLDVLTSAGIDPQGLAESVEFSAEGGYEAASRLLDAGATAIFASSDSQSQGAVAAVRERGLRIPEDVAVVGFDGTGQSHFSEPRLTVIAQPIGEIARRAVALLDGTPDVDRDAVPFELQIWSTCGC